MYKGKTFLAVIPARGGSKGVPRKNIRPLAGKPLIAWTIDVAKQSAYLDRCIVSTEDAEIAAIAQKYGGDVPFMRPAELAADDTPGYLPIFHAMDNLPPYDYVVTLQVTSPLRIAADIDRAIEICVDNDAPSCVSVTEAEHSPYWMYELDERGIMQPLIKIPFEQSYQRQKLPKVHRLNGAMYVSKYDFARANQGSLGEGVMAYVMPGERSHDIDSETDFRICEMLMQEKFNGKKE